MVNITYIFASVCVFAFLSFGFLAEHMSHTSQPNGVSFLAIHQEVMMDQAVPMVSEELLVEKESGEGISFDSLKREENYFTPLQKIIKRKAHEKELNFLVLGDFGNIDKNDTLSSTKRMDEFLANKVQNSFAHYDFALSMGDLLHNAEAESMEGQSSSIILEEALKINELGLDWYSTLGDHDCQGDMSKVYSLAQDSSHWKQKEPYYSKTFKIGSSRLKAGFIFPNGCELLCLKRNDPGCSKEALKNINTYKIQDQIDWLDDVLAKMSQDKMIIWKIVVLHHGIFSAGEAFGDSQTLKEAILPILAKHKVDLVLSGHENNMQYLRMDTELYEEQKEAANSNKKQEDVTGIQCPNMIDQELCVAGEFFHYELTKCGIVRKEDQVAYIQSLYHGANKRAINVQETKFSRESLTNQHDFLHQFIFGNGQNEVNKVCPLKQKDSLGKLRYANTDFGVGDIKIKENRIDVSLISSQNEVLYTVNIFRRHNYDEEL